MSPRWARLVGLLTAMFLVATLVSAAGAQEATPAATQASASPTREEVNAQIQEAYAFEEAQGQGGQVILGQTSDIATVNGLLTADYPTAYITYLMFEGLVGLNPVTGQPAPALADSWNISADGLTYTFNLSKTAKWHDGQDVTAEDAKFSMDVVLDEQSPNPRRSTVAPLVASYRVVDPDTFEIVATDKVVTFLFDVGGGFSIMPRHIWEGVAPADWPNDTGSTGQDASRVVGTGPFKFGEWVQGDHVTVVRNDAYYDPFAIPRIDELIIQILPEDAVEVEALKTGEIDIVSIIPPAQVEEIQNTEGLAVEIYDTYSFAYFALNLDPEKTPLFQDQRVREALFIALDTQAIKENIYLGYGEVAQGTQPKLSIAYAPDRIEKTYAFDPERAKQLLTEAGWTDTNGNGTVDKDGVEFEFELLTSGGSAIIDQILSYSQEAWREIGVAMTPKILEFAVLQEITDTTHDFDVVFQGFSWDPTANQSAVFSCAAYEGGFNISKYCNTEFDRLDEQQLREFDQQKRIDLLIQQSNIVWNDLPVLIFRFGVGRTGYNAAMHNYRPSDVVGGLGLVWSMPFVWLEQ